MMLKRHNLIFLEHIVIKQCLISLYNTIFLLFNLKNTILLFLQSLKQDCYFRKKNSFNIDKFFDIETNDIFCQKKS